MDERISRILEIWYLEEPPIFQIICTHEVKPNIEMKCAVRCGRRRLEYNPGYIREMSDEALAEALRTEAIRILMKHPYERRPDGCCSEAIALGSNVCIGDQYTCGNFNIERPGDFSLEGGRPFEWYARRIQEAMPDNGVFGDGSATNAVQDMILRNSERNQALSELWGEDEMMISVIDGVIESTTRWGSLSGSFAEMLSASTRARINWKKVFAGFRASILSSRRVLTRMRPSRRSGFEQMGSIRRFDTKLLVAVDVSGSISSAALSHFYGVVNSAFRYGFESIDVVQFDCGISLVQSLRSRMREVTAVGRGGTSFQEPIDYAHEKGYDGLLILTDGYAPQPTIPDGMQGKIIWVCQDQGSYDANHSWMEKTGRICIMEVE